MQLDENPYLKTEEAAPPAQPTYPQPEQPYQPTYQQPYQQAYQQPYQEQPYQQQPYQQPYQEPTQQQPYQQQPYRQQPYQLPYEQSYRQPYHQPYPPQNVYRAQPDRGAGMAKAFTIVSFITGILSLFSAMSGMLSMFFSVSGTPSLTSPMADGSLLAPCVMLAVPGLVFGIIALIKKTRLLPMAIIGVIMNGALAAVTLFSFIFENIL